MAIHASSKQRGFLSIDGVFWMMLIAVALGFITWMSWGMIGNSDVAIEQSNISTMIANTKKLKGSTGYGASGTNLVPSLINVAGTGSMGKSGTSLVNQWNGAVTVVSNGMTYTITEVNVPKSACIVLATKVAKDQQTTTSINGGSATSGEILGTAASTSCSTEANTIAWTVY
ncbi:type 4 pilus major pilin [Pseudomonas chlororaphis]|uniref:Conjugative transfer protein PilS in PFGI-1-like cluster n=1 Tax=Pseudomonas chlororaphis subsp. aureofaciens TaxID=587851 RepID=A0AAD0ZM60_9PSED|nr:type 4 pilus major pilin [Pseudomonas chlororaphis]AZC91298.1 Conjugative transfer protein PilS in PFGI-1-like cluster [Pseudomonas chlororaphis subsp. piscium]AZE31584.1 Conjugative transfer protein PilS in PFGI-1-like cluster [Pseudomonas chlororaphis subsp. aureofaciens]